jgi:hypothetical protein
MEFGLSLVAINTGGALGIGIIALVYKIQTINQSKRVRRLRDRLHVSVQVVGQALSLPPISKRQRPGKAAPQA